MRIRRAVHRTEVRREGTPALYAARQIIVVGASTLSRLYAAGGYRRRSGWLRSRSAHRPYQPRERQVAYDAWLGFLKSPWSLALHLLFFIGMIAHVWSWFQIMPKTMPRLVIGGRILPQNWITAAGLVVAMVAFIFTLVVAGWMQA